MPCCPITASTVTKGYWTSAKALATGDPSDSSRRNSNASGGKTRFPFKCCLYICLGEAIRFPEKFYGIPCFNHACN